MIIMKIQISNKTVTVNGLTIVPNFKGGKVTSFNQANSDAQGLVDLKSYIEKENKKNTTSFTAVSFINDLLAKSATTESPKVEVKATPVVKEVAKVETKATTSSTKEVKSISANQVKLIKNSNYIEGGLKDSHLKKGLVWGSEKTGFALYKFSEASKGKQPVVGIMKHYVGKILQKGEKILNPDFIV